MRIYLGDIVYTVNGERGIARELGVDRRILVQLGRNAVWYALDDLSWKGEALSSIPFTKWGWRHLGKRVAI